MSLVIENGQYLFKKGSRRLATSDHDVYRVLIELALDRGRWGYFPSAGHELKKFLQEKQTPETIDSLQKELKLYLKKYSPAVQEEARSRFKEIFNIEV